MNHELAEEISGLASRVNNLAVLHTGDDSRTFLQQQDQLAKLALAAIARDLDAQNSAYQAALQGIRTATAYLGDANQQIADAAKGIKLVAKAITLVTKALGVV